MVSQQRLAGPCCLKLCLGISLWNCIFLLWFWLFSVLHKAVIHFYTKFLQLQQNWMSQRFGWHRIFEGSSCYWQMLALWHTYCSWTWANLMILESVLMQHTIYLIYVSIVTQLLIVCKVYPAFTGGRTDISHLWKSTLYG